MVRALLVSCLAAAVLWVGCGDDTTANADPAPCSAGPVADTCASVRQAYAQNLLFSEFSIGVTAPTDWMNETRANHGCRWRWLAQYFCGGVAHGEDDAHHGWEEIFQRPWNQWVNPDSIPGMWGRLRIEDAIDNGFMPWITMYNLSQSAPALYSPGPAQAAPYNAKIPSTMRAYFEQFKLLFQIVAEYPTQPIVVHVEPDEWGHLLISVTGETLDPEAVYVSVGSCGMPEVCDLPNNVVGYARAIRRLRDTYAPCNALLCVSPSPWSPDFRLSAQNWYDMFVTCGINDWDLAVCETGSADLGQGGQPPPYSASTGMAGGIDHVIQWTSSLSTLSGLRFVMWQIPIGNTYYLSCNNTPGHYCHNSAQLLFEGYPSTNARISTFASGGGIGLIFSAGQDASTRMWDSMEDGVTNPAQIVGNLGNVSQYADDDGGYIRLQSANYFANTVALP